MAEILTTELKTRIKLKYATYSEWQSSTLTLLKGEIAVCEIPTANTHDGQVDDNGTNAEIQTIPTVLFKVGDGTKTFSQLPWASAKAADVYDWAKASDVDIVESTVEGKKVRKLTFVGTDKTVTLDYITPAEVEALTGAIAQDLASHTGDTENPHSVTKAQVGLGNVEDKSTATIKSEFKGSIAENNEGFVTGGDVHAAIAAASSGASGATSQVAQDLATHTSDKDNPHAVTKDQVGLGNVENKSTANIKTEFTGTVASGNTGFVTGGAVYTEITEAKNYTNTKVKEVSDAAGEIAEDLAEHIGNIENPHNVTKAQVGLDKVDNKSVTEIKTEFTGSVAANNDGFVTGGTVYTAVEAAKSYADDEVKELADGQVKTNTEAIAKNAEDLTKEAKAREDADKDLDERLDKIETFFNAKGEEEGYDGLNKALDTLVEIQDYLNGDGTASGSVITRIAAAEKDIDDLEAVVGPNGTLIQDFAQAQQDINNLEAATTGYSGDKTIASDIQVAKDNAAAAQAAADRANTAVFGTANGTVNANGLTSKVAALENTINGTSATDKGLAGDVAQNATDIAEVKGHYVYADTDNRLYSGNGTKGYIIFDCGGATE